MRFSSGKDTPKKGLQRGVISSARVEPKFAMATRPAPSSKPTPTPMTPAPIRPKTTPAPKDLSKEKKFYMAMLPAAEKVAASLNVPANAVLAQWAYESGWGNSKLARDGNNFGGIKTGGSSWKGEKISLPSKEKDGTEIAVSSFRKYESPEAYADDFIAFLGKPRYKNVKGAESAEDYAMRLGKAGYHQDTDGKYAKQVASIAKKLDQFSQPGFNRSLASNLQ